MLEKNNTSLQQYINNSYSVEVEPKTFIEINGNDYGQPYFMGTDTRPGNGTPADIYNSMKLSLTARPGSLQPVVNSDGVSTSLNTTKQSLGLNAGPGENSWYTQTPSNIKNVKFNMFLKTQVPISSEYEYLNSFNVVITAIGMDASDRAVVSEVVTENILIDNVDWTPVTIAFANPDEFNLINRVKLEISISVETDKRGLLLVSQLCYANTSEYEVFVRNRLPIETVFNPNRPGDFLIDLPTSMRPSETVSGSTIYQQCSGVHMVMAYALGSKYEKFQRSVTPYKNNPFVYYVSGSGWASKRVWAFYKNIVKTNKIVLKFNATAFKPQVGTYSIDILTSTGWVNIPGPAVDNNGIVKLFYKNGQWSTTEWTSSEFPRISTSGSLSGSIVSNVAGTDALAFIPIYGIAINVSNMTPNTDFSSLDIQRMDLIEVSPRLEVDLSNFIASVSIIKETDSENTFLNIGGVSSNSANVVLSNILITKNNNDSLNSPENDDIKPISNVSSASPLFGLFRKGIKVRTGFLIKSSTPLYVPSFYGYLDKWTESGTDITLSCFDVIKKLQSTKVASLYLRGKNVVDCIIAILDSSGISDVYYDNLFNLRTLSTRDNSSVGIVPDERIPYFWTDKDRTVAETLEDLFKVYQISMFVDEYGGIKFESLYNYNQYYSQLTLPTPTKQPDVYIQDADDSIKNIKSNLISSTIEENEIPKNITIKYKVPRPSLTEPFARRRKTKDENKSENKNSKKIKEEEKEYIVKPSTNIVWNMQDDSYPLPFIRIASPGITGISQNYLPFDVSKTQNILGAIPFYSELLIDDEIVSYEGIEYEFRYKTAISGEIKKTIERVMNSSEVITIQNELVRKGAVILYSPEPTGKLLNLKRGLYGTTPAIHTKQTASSIIKWSARQFTKSNSSYTNDSSGSSNISRSDGGITVNVNNSDKLIYLIPDNQKDDSELLRNKNRLSLQFKLSDIKSNNDAFFGAAIGTKISSGKLTSGLLVFVGVEENKKKTSPVIWVEQIVDNGTIKQIISKDQFSYSDDLVEEDENIEIFIHLNKKRDMCKILVGGTSIFEKLKSDDENNKKKDKKETSFKLLEPLPGSGSFGFIGKGSGGAAILGQFLFGNSGTLEDLNDLDINMTNEKYQKPLGAKADNTYFIGNNNLLDNIVSYQLISGKMQSAKDNFAWIGTPVARGMRVFEIDYESFPVITVPEVEYSGYSYELEQFESADIFSNGQESV